MINHVNDVQEFLVSKNFLLIVIHR